MTEREAFIEAIAADPGDDTARLAFADWLQERGEDARAEFVRLQCAIARGEPPADEWDEPRYDAYRDTLPPDEARAVDLLMRHWPDWFGPVLGAVGMPRPGPLAAAPPAQHSMAWHYPPYALPHRLWSARGLPLMFDSEFAPHRRRRKRPRRFLSTLRLDRGFAVGLRASLADATAGCSLAAALRLEPLAALALRVPPDPDLWPKLSHPALARIRDLELVAVFNPEGPDSSDAIDVILNDPRLGGVRSLALGVEYDGEDYDLPLPLSRAGAEAVLASAVGRGLHALRAGLESDAAAAFADADPPPDLRALSLECHAGGAAVPLPLYPYRARLERLWLSGAFEATALGGQRPWARLAELRLNVTIGVSGIAALAAPATFPALANLTVALAGADAGHTLADAVRAGQFPHLTALTVSGHVTGALVPLAEAVAVGTNIRVLDLHSVWNHAEAEYERVRELLGDRVRIAPPGDAIPF